MSVTTVRQNEDPHVDRWKQWQLANQEISRKDAARVRIAFAVVLIAAAAWLSLQLLQAAA